MRRLLTTLVCLAVAALVALAALAGLATAPSSASSASSHPAARKSRTAQPLVWGADATLPATTWQKPALRKRYLDPAYRTTVRRLTSAEGTRFDRNSYSRRQAENARGSLFLTYHGDAEYRVTNRRTLKLKRVLDIHPDAEPQWHPTHRARIRFIAGPNASTGKLQLFEVNVRNGRQRVVADLTQRLSRIWPTATYLADRAEGSPSIDGNRYAWIVYDHNEEPLGLVSYDLAADEILGTRLLRSDVGRADWVSASPTGAAVVVGYVEGTFAYDADLTNERRLNSKADHSDLALNADGEDAYVYIDFSSGVDGGWLVSIDLDTLERTRIFDVYEGGNTSMHISGKGYNKPGWVVVSTYNCKVDQAWTCDKVMAVEMQPGGRILNLAHTYNCGDNYWTETHAVVNRSFTRVNFNSDGGSCGIDAEVYQVVVPEFG